MSRIVTRVTLAALLAQIMLVAAASSAETWQRVAGKIGSSDQWGSGWLDLAKASDFKVGERLRLSIGGSARKVIVRLLAKGQAPDDPVGIVGIFEVPKDGKLEVTLDDDYPGTIQISVHGGPNPWGKFPLGGGNGPATLIKVERALP